MPMINNKPSEYCKWLIDYELKTNNSKASKTFFRVKSSKLPLHSVYSCKEKDNIKLEEHEYIKLDILFNS